MYHTCACNSTDIHTQDEKGGREREGERRGREGGGKERERGRRKGGGERREGVGIDRGRREEGVGRGETGGRCRWERRMWMVLHSMFTTYKHSTGLYFSVAMLERTLHPPVATHQLL